MSTDLAWCVWVTGALLVLFLGAVFLCIASSDNSSKFPRWWFWVAGIWIGPVAIHAWFIVVWLFLNVG